MNIKIDDIMKHIPGILSLLIIFASCSSSESYETPSSATIENAVSVVHAINGSEVSGTVTFEKTEIGVRVSASLSGLTGQKHGFHIHQFGNCTAADGTSAGGHFNPGDAEHAGPEAMNRHMGDMGNITADEEGNATMEYVDNTIEMEEIIGRGIIVHGGEDDLQSQPSGAAGPRIGCGVIGIAN